jgi:hypothetical protein
MPQVCPRQERSGGLWTPGYSPARRKSTAGTSFSTQASGGRGGHQMTTTRAPPRAASARRYRAFSRTGGRPAGSGPPTGPAADGPAHRRATQGGTSTTSSCPRRVCRGAGRAYPITTRAPWTHGSPSPAKPAWSPAMSRPVLLCLSRRVRRARRDPSPAVTATPRRRELGIPRAPSQDLE